MKTRRARRSLFGALISMLIVVGLALASAGAAVGGGGKNAGPPAAPPKTDADRDKLFDDLERRLAQLAPSERVDVLVRLAGDATVARIQAIEGAVGDVAVSARFSVVDAFAARMTRGQAEALARRSDVVSVEENARVRAFNDTARTSFGVTKAQVDAPGLDGDADGNAAAYSPGDLVAAVIDTGIAAGHADLDEGKVLAFKDFVRGKTEPYDDNGHGTHVAATIAGDGDARPDNLHRGVAPAAGLVGLKVLAADGSGLTSDIVAAIDWVVQNKDVYGIEVVNVSLGATGCSDGSDVASQAVNGAHAAGLVVAVAAGNEGPGTCTIGSPGAAAGALTVGAMADTGAGGFAQAAFSSRGPTFDGRIKPDVSAPGVAITSADAATTDGYVTWDGTSMATPFVAGVALLMRDANPALTSAEVAEIVRRTAIDWGRGGDNRTAGSSGADIDFGAGRLDAYAALAAAGAPLGVGPASPRHETRQGSLSATGAKADYALNVSDTAVPIAATLVLPGVSAATAASPDFDLFLYGPTGALVAASETLARQETISYRPTAAGTYTLRVYSYAGSGSFFVDVSAGLFVDTIAPSVTSVAPADGTTGVPATTAVSATFSEAMETLATQAAFSLARADTGAVVAGAFAWSGATMTFRPSVALAAGVQYVARVTTGAKDAAGNALAGEFSWRFTVAATRVLYPASTALLAGTVRSGDVTRLRADDNLYFAVNSTTSGTRVADWYGRTTGVSNVLKALKVTYRGMSSRTCSQTLYVYNWTTSSWKQINARSVGTTEVETTVSLTGTLADYVSGTTGEGELRARVRCARTDAYGFYVSGELMRVTVTQ